MLVDRTDQGNFPDCRVDGQCCNCDGTARLRLWQVLEHQSAGTIAEILSRSIAFVVSNAFSIKRQKVHIDAYSIQLAILANLENTHLSQSVFSP